jgi:hypothetical protein
MPAVDRIHDELVRDSLALDPWTPLAAVPASSGASTAAK